MIIDFRVRPPYKSFLNMVFYKSPEMIIELARSVGLEAPPSAVQSSMELFLQEMDEAGITTAVVAGRKAVPAWGSVENRDVAELVGSYPGRFIGLAGVDVSSRENTLRDLDEGLGELGLSGVSLDTGLSSNPIYPEDRAVYPVYERCADRDAVVMITSSNRVGPDSSWADPIHIERVAKDFPTLKIVVAHGCWPHVKGMIGLAFMLPNVHFMGDIYMVNIPGNLEYVQAANYIAQDQFLFATAYPVVPLDGTLRVFKSLPFREVALKKALYDNAARLLKLS